MTLINDAAALIRSRVNAAAEIPGERYMVDQSPDHGLILGVYAPGDVDDDGSISTSCAAYFAYPDDDQQAAYGRALAVATLLAGMDPVASLALADWLDSANENDAKALAFARAYLRTQGGDQR